ncbi:MAG: hypothetical protein AAF628_27715 [Planctomycetota bacterium]
MDDHNTTRDDLEEFLTTKLPAVLRRLRVWKGLCSAQHADVVDDLRQELHLDAIAHAPQLQTLSQAERHLRWVRIVEHRHYQLRGRHGRRTDANVTVDDAVGIGAATYRSGEPQPPRMVRVVAPSEPLAAPGRTEWLGATVAPALQRMANRDRELAVRLLGEATHLKNGRLNAAATVAESSLSPRDMRGAWGRIAKALGFGDDYVDFWRRRLVEALLGYAADDLRDAERVRILDERARRRPDPRDRLRRIASIKRHLNVRPLPPDLRQVLGRFTGRGATRTLGAADALDAAEQLLPGSAAVQLWRFEHAVVEGDLKRAARALRRARHAGAEPVAATLARARLLEARGREDAALALLERARRRARQDRRLTQAARVLRAEVAAEADQQRA